MNLTKRTSASDRVKLLKPGDIWTIFHDGNLVIDFEDGRGPRAPEVGEVVARWYSTGEPGREFRITAVHDKAIETVFIGFQEFEGEALS